MVRFAGLCFSTSGGESAMMLNFVAPLGKILDYNYFVRDNRNLQVNIDKKNTIIIISEGRSVKLPLQGKSSFHNATIFLFIFHFNF